MLAVALDERQRALVEQYVPLVRSRARRLAHELGISFDEADQDGALGLIRAAQRFDPDTGYAFSSFAVPHIDGAIRDGTRRSSWRRRCADRGQSTVPLDAPAGEQSDEAELADLIPDTLRTAELAELRTDYARALAVLTARERQVVYLRVNCDLSHPEVAAMLGTTAASIAQTWDRAKRRLAVALQDYDEAADEAA